MFRKQRVMILFAMAMGIGLLGAVTVQAATLDSIGATITDLKFFEGPDEGVPSANRDYSTRFEKQSTRFVYYELGLEHPAPGTVIDIPVTVYCYKPDGSEMFKRDWSLTIQPTWNGSFHWGGRGWSSPGNWEPGRYTLKIVEDQQEVASGEFQILTDIQAADAIFDWVQSLVPALAVQSTQTVNGVYFRYFPEIDYYIATYAGQLYLVDNVGGLTDIGKVNYWLGAFDDEPRDPDPIIKAITSAEGGVIQQESSGVAITVPEGAVPLQNDGSNGTLVFSIERLSEFNPEMPPGFTQKGQAYRLGPANTHFAMPVGVTLPVKGGLQAGESVEVFRMDEQTGVLHSLAGAYDPTSQTITAFTTEFCPNLIGFSSQLKNYIKVDNSGAAYRHAKGVYFLSKYLADLSGVWEMSIVQEYFITSDNSYTEDYKGELTLDACGTLDYIETTGPNKGATRKGAWSYDGKKFFMRWRAPNSGEITWESSQVTQNDINNGWYTMGSWSAQRTGPSIPHFCNNGITVLYPGAIGISDVASVFLEPGQYSVCVEAWAPPTGGSSVGANEFQGSVVLPNEVIMPANQGPGYYGTPDASSVIVHNLKGYDKNRFCYDRTVTPTPKSDIRDENVLDSCNIWVKGQSGGAGTTIDTWDISAIPPGAVFDFKFNAYDVPDKFIVEYPFGKIQLDTGWRGEKSYYDSNPSFYPGGVTEPGSGETLDIFTSSSGETSFRVTVLGPDANTGWDYEVRCRSSN